MAKNKTKKLKAPRVYRDATSGRFVTKKHAKKNPKTTVKERRVDTRSTRLLHPNAA